MVDHPFPATPDQLLAVIHIQTEIAKLGLDLSGVMNLVVDKALALAEAEGAVIELVEGDDMVYRAATGLAGGQLGLRVSRQSSLSGLCVASGKPLMCRDAENDPRVDLAACRKVGLRSMLVVPLKHDEDVVGVLKVLSSRPKAFTEAHVAVLLLMSELVGAAMYFAARYSANDLFHRATHDELTGLANRALFLDRLRNTLAQAERHAQPFGLLIADLDSLKQVNDRLGHRAGDAALQEFAARLSSTVRKSDTVARHGGDEFSVILTPLDGYPDLIHTRQRLIAATEGPLRFEGMEMILRASIGAALYPDDAGTLDGLLEFADQAMYALKRQRKAIAESQAG